MIDLGEYLDHIERHSDVIVHAMRTGDGRRIARLIDLALIVPAPENVVPDHALIMMLAAQVDPDASREQRLGWTDGLGPAVPA